MPNEAQVEDVEDDRLRKIASDLKLHHLTTDEEVAARKNGLELRRTNDLPTFPLHPGQWTEDNTGADTNTVLIDYKFLSISNTKKF